MPHAAHVLLYAGHGALFDVSMAKVHALLQHQPCHSHGLLATPSLAALCKGHDTELAAIPLLPCAACSLALPYLVRAMLAVCSG